MALKREREREREGQDQACTAVYERLLRSAHHRMLDTFLIFRIRQCGDVPTIKKLQKPFWSHAKRKRAFLDVRPRTPLPP